MGRFKLVEKTIIRIYPKNKIVPRIKDQKGSSPITGQTTCFEVC
jgi:hypothetical protein